MRTIAIINLKGGTAKTTTTVNLAAELQHRGKRVLCIDADPQHNLTDFYGADADGSTITDLLAGRLPDPGLLVQRVGSGIGELFAEFLRRMEDKTPPNYLRWGIRQLDEVLTAEPGDCIVLGADSSVGKTALAVQLAWNMASHGRRVGFFSLETSAHKLADRMVAQRARVELQKIKHKELSAHDIGDVVAVGAATSRMCLSVTEAAGFRTADLRAATLANRYDVIFIDYVQLLNAEGRERWEIVTRISMELHTMAQQLGVAVIALSQLTPPDKSKGARRAPSRDDLRESPSSSRMRT